MENTVQYRHNDEGHRPQALEFSSTLWLAIGSKESCGHHNQRTHYDPREIPRQSIIRTIKTIGSSSKTVFDLKRFNKWVWKLQIKYSFTKYECIRIILNDRIVFCSGDGDILVKYVHWNLHWNGIPRSCPFHWSSEIFHHVYNIHVSFYSN